MVIHRAAILLTMFVITGCGIVSQSGPPAECGLEDAQVAWAGNASLAGLGLEPPPDFPRERRGEVYVTEPGQSGRRTYCVILDRGSNEQWTQSGETPEGWDLPDAPPSN